MNCGALKEVTLPSSLTELGELAFGNSGLTEIHVPETVELLSFAADSFNQYETDVQVYVKSGSWADQNFDDLFGGTSQRQLSSHQPYTLDVLRPFYVSHQFPQILSSMLSMYFCWDILIGARPH